MCYQKRQMFSKNRRIVTSHRRPSQSRPTRLYFYIIIHKYKQTIMKTLSIIHNKKDATQTKLALTGPLAAMHAINIKSSLFEEAIQAEKSVVLDLKEITQFDISGLNTLITTYRRLKEQGVKFSVTGLINEDLTELLSLTGFHKVLIKAA